MAVNILGSPLEQGNALLQSAAGQAQAIQQQQQQKLALLGSGLGKAAEGAIEPFIQRQKDTVVLDELTAKSLAANLGDPELAKMAGQRVSYKKLEILTSAAGKMYGYKEGTKRAVAKMNAIGIKATNQKGEEVTFTPHFYVDPDTGEIDGGIKQLSSGIKPTGGKGNTTGKSLDPAREMNMIANRLLKARKDEAADFAKDNVPGEAVNNPSLMERFLPNDPAKVKLYKDRRSAIEADDQRLEQLRRQLSGQTAAPTASGKPSAKPKSSGPIQVGRFTIKTK